MGRSGKNTSPLKTTWYSMTGVDAEKLQIPQCNFFALTPVMLYQVVFSGACFFPTHPSVTLFTNASEGEHASERM